jgi:carbon storage regulator CsrA
MEAVVVVLSRQQDESVVISDGQETIEITIIRAGRRVRLGFQSPKKFTIDRREVYERRSKMLGAKPTRLGTS